MSAGGTEPHHNNTTTYALVLEVNSKLHKKNEYMNNYVISRGRDQSNVQLYLNTLSWEADPTKAEVLKISFNSAENLCQINNSS